MFIKVKAKLVNSNNSNSKSKYITAIINTNDIVAVYGDKISLNTGNDILISNETASKLIKLLGYDINKELEIRKAEEEAEEKHTNSYTIWNFLTGWLKIFKVNN